MWQRIQTIFLVISALAAVSFLFVGIADDMTGKDNIAASAVAVAIALLQGFIISMYKDRKVQMRFCTTTMLLALAMGVLAYVKTDGTHMRLEFVIGIPVLIILSSFLARYNIKKDEDLVKSMDRMR
jgi:peptidoglycan/LPS O-acetylase OafA/YrhL